MRLKSQQLFNIGDTVLKLSLSTNGFFETLKSIINSNQKWTMRPNSLFISLNVLQSWNRMELAFEFGTEVNMV